jgi:hypothetical protein
MCRGSIQERFANASSNIATTRTKKATGSDHDHAQFCLEVCDRIVGTLSQGYPVDVACANAGIGRTTFYRWLERARLPDAPPALRSFHSSVLTAKRVPKQTLAPAVAKVTSAIRKVAANSRSKQRAFAPSQDAVPILEACNLHPPVDYVNYRYLPALFRSHLLVTIHSLARDFPLDKKLSDLADDERCVFESLVNAIAAASCQLPSPLTFPWYGRTVCVAFANFEFSRPIIHRLAARYIRDRQRHIHHTSSPVAVDVKDGFSPCSLAGAHVVDCLDQDLCPFHHCGDELACFNKDSSYAMDMDDSLSCSPCSTSHLSAAITFDASLHSDLNDPDSSSWLKPEFGGETLPFDFEIASDQSTAISHFLSFE